MAVVLHLIYLLCSPLAFAEKTKQSAAEVNGVNFKTDKEVVEFIDYMVTRHAFNREQLVHTFNQMKFNPQSIQLVKPSPNPNFKNWEAYRSRFVEPRRISAGLDFWDKYADVLDRAEKQFGVPAQIIVGIIGVETIYGRNVGNFRVVDVLGSLAFAYPETPNKATRMAYFRGELEQCLLYAREAGIDPLTLVGSYAGAIGWPQFMPSSIRQFGVDFEGNGKIDLRSSPVDAIGSVANFLKQHGWNKDIDLPIVYPATIVGPHPEAIENKDLNATFTRQQLASVAISTRIPNANPAQDPLLYGLVDLQNGKNPTEYWLATQNFFAITKYNRSYFYAMSVIDLGNAIDAARQQQFHH